MAITKISAQALSRTLAQLLCENLSLTSLPETAVKASLGTLTFESDNLATHQHFSLYRDLHAVGKGYLTDPEKNLHGSVASMEILLTGTLHDGHETAMTFASLDLFADGQVAFIRFGDEASDLRQAA